MAWKSWKGRQLKSLTRKNMHQALVRAAEATLAQTQMQVPLEEGTLQETGIVLTNPANPLDVIISYGGGPGTGFQIVPYAIKQHEVPMNHTDGRSHNYLRNPIKTFAPRAVKNELIKAGRKSWS